MAKPSAASGDGMTLRQYVTLRVIAQMGGKASSADIRAKLAEGGLEVSSTGNRSGLMNMAKVGWVDNKVEDRANSHSGADMPTNVWKLTQAGKAVVDKAKTLLAVLAVAKKEK